MGVERHRPCLPACVREVSPRFAWDRFPPLAAVSSEPMDGGPNCRGLFLLQPLTGYRGLPLGNADILVGGTLIAGPGSILDRTT